MSEIKRADVKTGMRVKVIMKEDQRTGKLTEGIVKDILTCLAGRQAKSPKHPHGIKVRLETGEVGRVKEILE
jgi:uncharacterized repeat protein (TIGR03833 family)